MEYRIIKPFNNNVVLVCEPGTNEQIVLMSKGIGFNRKAGELVSDDMRDGQVYKFWNGTRTIGNVEKDMRKIEAVVQEIVELAGRQMNIRNDGLYSALLDHISFAVDRLHFALPIENPFLNEISIFYSQEYEIANRAVELIRSRLNLEMGEAEAGYIALHLRSARKNKSVGQSLDNMRIYNQIVSLVSEWLYEDLSVNFSETRAFLLSLDNLIQLYGQEESLSMPCRKAVFKDFSKSRQIAESIALLVEKEMKMKPDEDFIGFLTIDLEKLKQTRSLKRKD